MTCNMELMNRLQDTVHFLHIFVVHMIELQFELKKAEIDSEADAIKISGLLV